MPNQESSETVRLPVRLDADMYRQLIEIATREGVAVAELLRASAEAVYKVKPKRRIPTLMTNTHVAERLLERVGRTVGTGDQPVLDKESPRKNGSPRKAKAKR